MIQQRCWTGSWASSTAWILWLFLSVGLSKAAFVPDRWKHLVLNWWQCTQVREELPAGETAQKRGFCPPNWALLGSCLSLIQVYFWKDISEHVKKNFMSERFPDWTLELKILWFIEIFQIIIIDGIPVIELCWFSIWINKKQIVNSSATL